MTIVVVGQRVVVGDRLVEDAWVQTEGERVLAVGTGAPPRGTELVRAAAVVPGFVDLHVHGGGGASFDQGPAAAEAVLRFHRAHGTTTMLASLVTAPAAALAGQVAGLARLVAAGRLAGLHLEGPWLSPEHAGAHDPALLRSPQGDELASLVSGGAGAVRMVTLAPELPGALAAVRALHRQGVLVAVGHTGASYDGTRAAVDAGARVATHLFNAMPPWHHRDPGPVGALLEDPRVTVELVADGVHTHPSALRLALAAAGPHRVALVTDAIAAAGCGDGESRLGGRRVQVRDGTARLAGQDVLAGSVLTTAAAFGRVVHELGVSLVDASAMASATPARVLGRPDLGALAPGRRADLVLLDARLDVVRVLAAGRWVGERGCRS